VSAIFTKSASDLAPIFRVAWPRCTFTVISVTPISAATCLFNSPPVTHAMTSCSRGVRESNLARNAETAFSFSRLTFARSMPDCTASNKSWSRKGLVRNSTAPAFIALTDIGMSPWPVMNMTGISILALANSAWKSSPPVPGSRTSRIRQHGASGRFVARKSGAEANPSTRNPTDRIKLLIAPRCELSSSTTNTIGCDSAFSFFIADLAKRY